MSKKQVSRKERRKDRTRMSEIEVLFRVPEGLRVEAPKPGKSLNEVSNPLEGFTVEVNLVEMFRTLAQLRKKIRSPSDLLEREFVALWRRGLWLRARLFRVRRRPAGMWTSEEVWELKRHAVEVGIIGERLVWKFGGLLGELARRMDSRLRTRVGLAEANKKREAGLTEGLEHKLNLMCKWKPKISRRAVAQHLLDESEQDSLSCHDCQLAKCAKGDQALLPDERCESYRRYGKCRKCDDCIRSYMRLVEWRDFMREGRKAEDLTEERVKTRLCDTLSRRLGKLDLRPRRRQDTRRVRRGVSRR